MELVVLGDRTDITQAAEREIAIWSLLSHPNICNFNGFWSDGHAFYLVAPFFKFYDLARYIKKRPTAARMPLVSRSPMLPIV